MNTTILLKRSGVPGQVPLPEHLVSGELAINTSDGILFFKGVDDAIKSVGNVYLKTINGESIKSDANIFIGTKEDLDLKSNLHHTHEIGSLIPVEDKNFISNDIKIQIEDTEFTTDNLNIRINDLLLQHNGQVKLNKDSTGVFLEYLLDGKSVTNTNGVLVAKNFSGSEITLHELNSLAGITGNVQGQLDTLNNLFRYRTSVATYADLLVYPTETLMESDLVIVISDEMKNGTASLYVYDGDVWVFSGEFLGTQQRDFTTDPLSLSTEVTGILDAASVGFQLAVDTPITDAAENFTSTNVEGALLEFTTKIDRAVNRIITEIPLTVSPNADNIDGVNDALYEINSRVKGALITKGVPVNFGSVLSDVPSNIRSIEITSLGNVSNREVVVTEDNTPINITLQNIEDISKLCVTLFKKLVNDDYVLIDKSFNDSFGYRFDRTKLYITPCGLKPIILSTMKYNSAKVDDSFVTQINELHSAILF